MIDPALIIVVVRAKFPELTEAIVPDAFFLAWMDWAKAQAGTRFGLSQMTAIALLLAHAWYKYGASKGSGVNGLVTSVNTGRISASFSVQQQSGKESDMDLLSTFAGAAFVALRNSKARIMMPGIYT